MASAISFLAKHVFNTAATAAFCFIGLAHAQTESAKAVLPELTVHENCNEGQRSRMERAFVVSHTAVIAAQREVRADSPIYHTWFGDWSDRNGFLVNKMLVQVLRAWASEFRCGGGCCDSNAFGCFRWHFPSSRFYVCHAWHSTPPLSVEATSNRAGTIAHELTHFFGTKDIKDISSCGPGDLDRCYGADKARRLAMDPTCRGSADGCKAVYSAENYEHFVSDVLVNIILTIQ